MLFSYTIYGTSNILGWVDRKEYSHLWDIQYLGMGGQERVLSLTPPPPPKQKHTQTHRERGISFPELSIEITPIIILQ